MTVSLALQISVPNSSVQDTRLEQNCATHRYEMTTGAKGDVVIDLISDDEENDEGSNKLTANTVFSFQNRNHDEHATTTTACTATVPTTTIERESQIVRLQLFQSILPQFANDDALKYLIAARWNVEAAVTTALLDLSSDTTKTTTSTAFTGNQYTTSTSQTLNVTTKLKRQRINETFADSISGCDDNDDKRLMMIDGDTIDDNVSTQEQEQQRNTSGQPNVANTRTDNSSTGSREHFIDSDFPPTSQSIDGRERTFSATTLPVTSSSTTTITSNNDTNSAFATDDDDTATTNSKVNMLTKNRISTTKCDCGVLATPKQVQSDGPNYGRFYLCCGNNNRSQRQPPPIQHPTITKRDKTILVPNEQGTNRFSTNRDDRCDDDEDESDDRMTEESIITPQPMTIVVRNPYLIRKRETIVVIDRKAHGDPSIAVATATAVTNNNNNNQKDDDDNNDNNQVTSRRPPDGDGGDNCTARCNFFQWDSTGVLGTINSQENRPENGYQLPQRGSIRNHISWFRFSIEQRCTLFASNYNHNHNKKKVDVSHIQQGTVGDCWFLSALTVVAEQSYLIEQILPPKDVLLNDWGCYQIKLFLDGLWQPILVDSYLPVVFKPLSINNKSTKQTATKNVIANRRNGIPVQIKDNTSKPSSQVIASHSNRKKSILGPLTTGTTSYLALPAFCATPDRILWPALIEKAYAKAHGSYQQLSGGYIAEGLQDLTGAPCDTYVFDALSIDVDMFWMKLLSFHTAGFVMGVATYSGGDGLVGGHAYSILDVLDIPDAVVGEQPKVTDFFTNKSSSPTPTTVVCSIDNTDRKEENEEKIIRSERTSIRLIRIRNPWGKREWKGDWSVSSDQWTRTLRKQLGTKTTYAKGDGTFYMSYHDMLQRFHHLDVAKTQRGWVNTAVDGIFVNGVDPLLSSKFIYELSVTKTTQVYLSIIQPKKRSNTKTQYWYCDPSMILLRKVNDGEKCRWEHVAWSLNGVKRQCHLEIFLEASGIYFCVPWSFALSCDHPFRLVTYSGSPVIIKSLPCSEDDNCSEYLKSSSVREFALDKLFSELIVCNDSRHVHPIIDINGMKGVVLGTYDETQSSFYILAVNGSPDHYLSLRISCDITAGSPYTYTVLTQNRNTMLMKYQDFDVPPLSQQFLLVVTHSGTRTRQNTPKCPSLHYVSSWVAASHEDTTTKNSTKLKSFGNRMNICPLGQNVLNLHCSVDSSSLATAGGSGIIQTSFEFASAILGRVSLN